jgi:hypothetical protein
MCLNEVQIALGDLQRSKELSKQNNTAQAQYLDELISDLV